MVERRVPRGGLLISSLGSAVLAVSVFLPWYSISFTAAGAAEEQQQFAALAQKYAGDAHMQALANQMGAGFGAMAGRTLITQSAHDVLKDISVVLLLLAGVALLASLLRLAEIVEVGGDQIALLGFAAALCVLLRILSPPAGHTDLVALSPVWGSWVALAAAIAILVGGLWTPSAGQSGLSPAENATF